MIDFIENVLLVIANRIRNDGKSCGHIFHRHTDNSYLVWNDKLKRVEEKFTITNFGKTLEATIY